MRSSVPATALVEGGATQASGVLHTRRCLRPSYRLGLMCPGDRCLLWVSGRERPGVHAVGRLADSPVADGESATVGVELHLLPRPVPRTAWLGDARLSGAEVIRMPAGSNPSYVTPEQLATLDELLGAGALA